MRDARDKNKADDEKRKVMIASVAHDLKTPLAVISGYAESLSDGMDDKDYTALILQKTEEMNSQVLTLVESSRNEIQSIGSIKESVLFGEFFKTEALKYEKLAQSKKLTFIVKGAPYVTVYAATCARFTEPHQQRHKIYAKRRQNRRKSQKSRQGSPRYRPRQRLGYLWRKSAVYL